MNDLSNGAIVPMNLPAEAGQYLPINNPNDARFHTLHDRKVVIDQEGHLYKQTEVEHFLSKTGTRLVELASLKLNKALVLMAKALESRIIEDCEALYKELEITLHAGDELVSFDEFRSELIEAKTQPEILETPAKFRLTDKQIKILQDYQLQNGKIASKIFNELGKLPNGKSVLLITTISK
jgi:hypothetical protein